MREITLTESCVRKLKRYPLSNILSSESTLYYFKKNQDRSNILFKKLYRTDDKIVNRKLSTIERLQNSDFAKYPELVIPEDYVTIGGVKSGFMIKEVTDCTNLHLFLESKTISRTDKIEVLKKIGELLKKVQSQGQEFYFGDLQSYNFLIGKDLSIYVVDLDSSAIRDDEKLEAKYIILDQKAQKVSKYRADNSGRIYPSTDTDIFCYNTMVLNHLAGRPLHRLSFDDYYQYICYLKDCAIPQEMIDIYANIYTDKKNESVGDYLDFLPTDYPRVDYRVYSSLKKR